MDHIDRKIIDILQNNANLLFDLITLRGHRLAKDFDRSFVIF